MHDLRNLGAKLFFPAFCTGGLTHIGTKRLQEILLKDCLLLGVKVGFGRIITSEIESPILFVSLVQSVCGRTLRP